MDWQTTSHDAATSTATGPVFPTVLCSDTGCP